MAKKSFLEDIVSRNDEPGEDEKKTELRNSGIKDKRNSVLEKKPMAKDKKEKITFYLDRDFIKKLKILAIQEDKKFSQLVEDSLQLYFKKKKV